MKKTNLLKDLQRFAIAPTTPGSNDGTSSANGERDARMYRQQFVDILKAVFESRSYFGPFFGGIETLDDISNNDTAFTLKVNNTPVTGKAYDTSANVAFGTGTASTSRFGEMDEIIYQNIAVGYGWSYAWHEGIDRFTVNNGLAEAIADRTGAQAEFKVDQFNANHGKFIGTTATALTTTGAIADLATLLVDAFNEASTTFTNIKARGVKRAYVKPAVWNALVDNGLTTTDKEAGVNIADNMIHRFKGFILEEVPDSEFNHANDLVYFTIDNSAYAFTGIATARTIEAVDFDGVAFQGAGRAGEYILEDNKKAVLKLVVTP